MADLEHDRMPGAALPRCCCTCASCRSGVCHVREGDRLALATGDMDHLWNELAVARADLERAKSQIAAVEAACTAADYGDRARGIDKADRYVRIRDIDAALARGSSS